MTVSCTVSCTDETACTPSDTQAMGLDAAVSGAEVLKALADPTRLRILSAIATDPRGESCVCDLTGLAPVSQPTFSHHLRVMRDVGILISERRGTWVWYRIAPGRAAQVGAILAALNPGDTRPSVLFVCVRNGGKSQMAAALMRHRAGTAVEVHSAGTDPGTALNQQSATAVAEVGASMEAEFPKPIDPALMMRVDHVILVGAEAKLDPLPGMVGNITTWNIDEPSLRGVEGDARMREIREQLNAQVDELLGRMLVEK